MTEQTHAGMDGEGNELFVQKTSRGRTPHGRGALRSLQWLLIFVFALAAGAANAGYYTVTYKDGTYTLDTHAPVNDSGSNGGWGGGGFSPFFASCSGTITATFKWNASNSADVPPNNVIVEENSNAQAVYFGAVPLRIGSAAASNGLGTTPVTVVDAGTGGTLYTTTCNGTKYTIKTNPGASFTMYGNPSATSSDGGGYCTAGFSYSAIPHVVYFNLVGTMSSHPVDGVMNIQIGQGCQGSMTAPGITFRNYHWIVGGDTFKSYVAHGYYSGAKSTVTFMSAADWQQASPAWFWRSDGITTVQCTADAYDSNNNLIGSVGDAAAVDAWCPIYSCGYNAGAAYVWNRPLKGIWLQAINITPTGVASGMKWTGQAVPQDLFTGYSGQSSGKGLWSWVQMIIPGGSYIVDPGVTHIYPDTGLLGLDTSYPYAPDGGIMIDDNDNDGYKDDFTLQSDGDSPGMSLDDTVSSAVGHSQFWTYMMYRPVANSVGNQWVPLHRIAWQWQANVTRPYNALMNPANSWANAVLPWLVGTVTVTEDARCKTHPIWNRVLLAQPY